MILIFFSQVMMTSSNNAFKFIRTEYSTHQQYKKIAKGCCAVRETAIATQQAGALLCKFWAQKESVDGVGVC
jgi:hypothetical protein